MRNHLRKAALLVTAVAATAGLAVAGPAAAETTPSAPAPTVEASPNGGPDVQPKSWTGCNVYESGWTFTRHACFNPRGRGLYVEQFAVWFDASRKPEGGDYTYVNARYNVDRPNGQTWFGTNGGAVNIMNGYSMDWNIWAFVEPGDWCLRYQLQRTNGVWENWQQVCGPIWA